MITFLVDTSAVEPPIRQQDGHATMPRRAHSRRDTWREQRPPANVDQILDDSFPASDPPSWTSAIVRVASTSNGEPSHDALVRRIRAAFLEMPGLCLTIGQAQRLWSLEPRTCEAVLASLTDGRFLRRTDRGFFVLSASGA